MSNLAKNLGFGIKTSLSLSEQIKMAKNPTTEQSTRRAMFETGSKRDIRLQRLIQKASIAYSVDGILRQAIDRYSESFKDFQLQGSDKAKNYLENRLNMISLQTGEHWKALLSRIIEEYFKVGNAFILKVRGKAAMGVKRPLYRERPWTLSGLYLVSADRLDPATDGNNNFVGWKLRENKNTPKTVLDQSKTLDRDKALISLGRLVPEVFNIGADIIQIAYKKGADSLWGVGLALPVLEDLTLLRTIETSVSILIKKNTNPIIHHKITRAADPRAGAQTEINQAYLLHQRSAPDGVIITGPNHEIKAVGSESQALRVQEYMKYFINRVFSGLGVSPAIMGFETTTIGTAEHTHQLLLAKILYCQEAISRDIEFFLFNELLWEGGFDPYSKESDRVKLVFEEADKEGRIKRMSAAADLYNKNLLDHDQALTEAGISSKPKPALLYLNQVQIPLEKAKARFKAAARPINSSAEIRDIVSGIIPKEKSLVPDMLKTLESLYGFDRETLRSLEEPISNLIEDPEAITELFVQSFGEE